MGYGPQDVGAFGPGNNPYGPPGTQPSGPMGGFLGLQLQDQQQPQQRPRGPGGGMPFSLNPYERDTLQNLASALSAGLDPSLGMQLMDQTIGGATDRRTQNLATRDQGLQSLMDQAAQYAASGADPASIQALVDQQGQALPAMGARSDAKLQNIISTIPELAGLNPEAAGGVGLDPADKVAIVDSLITPAITAARDESGTIPQAGASGRVAEENNLRTVRERALMLYGDPMNPASPINQELAAFINEAWANYGGVRPYEQGLPWTHAAAAAGADAGLGGLTNTLGNPSGVGPYTEPAMQIPNQYGYSQNDYQTAGTRPLPGLG